MAKQGFGQMAVSACFAGPLLSILSVMSVNRCQCVALDAQTLCELGKFCQC